MVFRPINLLLLISSSSLFLCFIFTWKTEQKQCYQSQEVTEPVSNTTTLPIKKNRKRKKIPLAGKRKLSAKALHGIAAQTNTNIQYVHKTDSLTLFFHFYFSFQEGLINSKFENERVFYRPFFVFGSVYFAFREIFV